MWWLWIYWIHWKIILLMNKLCQPYEMSIINWITLYHYTLEWGILNHKFFGICYVNNSKRFVFQYVKLLLSKRVNFVDCLYFEGKWDNLGCVGLYLKGTPSSKVWFFTNSFHLRYAQGNNQIAIIFWSFGKRIVF